MAQDVDEYVLEDGDVPGMLAPPQTHVSASVLQRNLRQLFLDNPTRQALTMSLSELADYMDGVYLKIHATIGGQLFSEAWMWDNFDAAEAMGEMAKETMALVMSSEKARCTRIGQIEDLAPAVIAVPIYDANSQLAGAAAVVVGPCDRDKARDVLAMFEGVVGYVSLLASGVQNAADQTTDEISIPVDAQRAAKHPVFLAHSMAARLKNRNALEQVVVAFVQGNTCKVAAVCGIDTVRLTNPGVKLAQSAMQESLDLGKPVVCAGINVADEDDHPAAGDDFRIHSQWSFGVGGDAVASFPVHAGEDIVAVVGVRAEAAIGITQLQLESYKTEMEKYAVLIGTAVYAGRSLPQHLCDSGKAALEKTFGKKGWKSYTTAAVVGLFVLWLFFGTMSYSILVPSEVAPAHPWVVSSPREGLLAEVLVQPGDRVKKGMVLARLECRDDELRASELQAEVRRASVKADQARADNNPAEAKVLAAEEASLQAQLSQIRLRIERSNLVAAREGVVLNGDLRKRIGGKLSLGEPLFELAVDGRVIVQLKIPHDRVWDGREAQHLIFSPSAKPDERIELKGLRVSPGATVEDGKNVFLAETTAFAAPDHLSPGMEGVVHLEIGNRSVWWVLTHRLTDWMYLNSWF